MGKLKTERDVSMLLVIFVFESWSWGCTAADCWFLEAPSQVPLIYGPTWTSAWVDEEV